MTRLPPGEQWLLRRVEPGEPFEAVDIEGHGVVACKMDVIPGTHPSLRLVPTPKTKKKKKEKIND
jgi:hypothetical protein